MKKISLYIIIALLLLMIGGYFYLDHGVKKERAKFEQKIELQQIYIDSLEVSKSQDTIIYDTIEVANTVTVTKWLPVDSFQIYQELTNKYVLIREYADSLKTSDFTLPYRISVNGYLDKVEFGNYELFTKEVIKEHIVKVPYPVIQEVEASQLYLYTSIGSVDMTKRLSWDVGVNYLFKRKWGLGIGYQRVQGLNVYKVNVNFRIL